LLLSLICGIIYGCYVTEKLSKNALSSSEAQEESKAGVIAAEKSAVQGVIDLNPRIRYTGTAMIGREDMFFIYKFRAIDLCVALQLFILSGFLLLLLNKVFSGLIFSWSRLTLPGFFHAMYLTFFSVPSIIWFCLDTDPVRIAYYYAAQLVPVIIAAGSISAFFLLKISGESPEMHLPFQLTRQASDRYLPLLILVFMLLSGLIALIYIKEAKVVPLFISVLKYGSSSGQLVRHSIYDSSEAVQYFYALAVRFFLPLSVLVSFFMARVYKAKWKIYYWVILAFSLFCSLLSLEKSNLIGLFAVLLLGYYCVSKKIISWANICVIFLALLLGGLVKRAQYQLDIDVGQLPNYMSQILISRMWLDPSYMCLAAFHKYNAATMFLHGHSIKLFSFFGLEFTHFSSIGFVGDLWVNFGWWGILIGSFTLGFILQSAQLLFHKKTDILRFAIFVLLLVNSVWIIYGSVLSIMVLSVYGSSIFLLLILVPILDRVIKKT